MRSNIRLNLLLTLFASSFALVACSDDPEAEKEVVVSARIGAAGGTLVFDNEDGSSFELRVPAAALSGEQEISIRRVPAAEWPPETAANPPVGGHVFELLPEGTTFTVPVTTVTRLPAAPPGLGSREAQTLPSHVSRSSAGSMQRHPTVVHSRSDGSAVVIGRSTHFSAHWATTETPDGQFGVNFTWPAGPFGIEATVMPTAFSVWTSSETPVPISMDIGVFVEMPTDVQILGSGYYEYQESAFGSEIQGELQSFLDDMGDTRVIDTEGGLLTSSLWLNDPGMGIVTEYPVGEPYVLEPMIFGPAFSCWGLGAGTGFVIVRTFVSDGEGGSVPLIYVDEVKIECADIVLP